MDKYIGKLVNLKDDEYKEFNSKLRNVRHTCTNFEKVSKTNIKRK